MLHNNLLSVVVFAAIACVVLFAILVISASNIPDNEEAGVKTSRRGKNTKRSN